MCRDKLRQHSNCREVSRLIPTMLIQSRMCRDKSRHHSDNQECVETSSDTIWNVENVSRFCQTHFRMSRNWSRQIKIQLMQSRQTSRIFKTHLRQKKTMSRLFWKKSYLFRTSSNISDKIRQKLVISDFFNFVVLVIVYADVS